MTIRWGDEDRGTDVTPSIAWDNEESVGTVGMGDFNATISIPNLEKIYYFRTEDNQNLQRIRLQDAQLDAGATRGKLDMVENKLPFFHDAASAVVRS